MTEKIFQAAVRYGGIALALGAVLNIWVVLRHVEVYRDASRAETQFQQLALRQQILQGVLQDFSARANSDPHIAEIFKKVQVTGAPVAAPASQNRQ